MNDNSIYDIRYCKISEYELLIDFINEHWKKGHIFTKNKKLLDWQHLNEHENRYNFVVAYNKVENRFDAILGFIPTYQYDKDLFTHKEIWLAIWKVRDDSVKRVSGIQLLFYLNNKYKPNTICSIGITDSVKSIYDAFKYKRGKLKHYYIISSTYKPNISKIINKCDEKVNNIENYKIKEIDFYKKIKEINRVILNSNQSIIKSLKYIENRYIKHPIYKYSLFGIFKDKNLVSFFIVRKINVNNSTCLRIIDYFGDFIDVSLASEFYKLIDLYKLEYIDIVCYLPDFSKLEKMGFLEKTEKDIIPEYFEPFERKNIDLNFAYKSKKSLMIFKGDSDQDRPNKMVSEVI